MRRFDDARLKIDRAGNHISELDTIVRSLPERYSSTIESDPQGRGNSIRYYLPNSAQLNATVALILGDAIHALRTSLDYAWFIASNGEERGKYCKFPVCNSAKELDGRLQGAKLDITHPSLFERMRTKIQPTRDQNWHLWALHELDIIDKHRLLLPIVRAGSISGLAVEDEQGIEIGSTGTIASYEDSFRVAFLPNIQIKAKGTPVIEVWFGAGVNAHDGLEVLETAEIVDTLKAFERAVVITMDSLESAI
jgi:hypothetical protein